MDLLLAFVSAVGSVICHQLPERSFFLDGRQLPVCARCTGLYVSGAAGLIGWWAVKFGRTWRRQPVTSRAAPSATAGQSRWAIRLLLIAGTPTVVSYLSGVTGVWDGSNLTRAILAMPLGLTAGAVVAAVATKDLR